MRVVAIWLKLKILIFTETYHSPDGSSFTSVSTYLKNNSSGCPSSTPRRVWLSSSLMGSNMHLSSHRETVVSQCLMDIIPMPWQQFVWTIQKDGHITHSGPTCSLRNDDSFPKHVWHFRISAVFPTLHIRNSQNKRSFGKKTYD